MPQHTVLPLHFLWHPWLASLGYSGPQVLISEGKVAEVAPDETEMMLTRREKHPEEVFGMIFELSLLMIEFAS